MATSKESSTPRKVYVNKNNCVLCGFTFIQTEVSGTGEETVKKFLKLKLRLNAERIETIESVIDNFRPTDEEKELHDVCIKLTNCTNQILNTSTRVNNYMFITTLDKR